MKQNTYNIVSSVVFTVVAIAHAIRAYNNWNITVYDFTLPIWVSWLAVILLAYLAYQGFKKK